ncbi:MAG: hypothetical protein HOB32_01455 [Nitrospina sp.]|nr:hypothetical protein [Nitrospina sp.]
MKLRKLDKVKKKLRVVILFFFLTLISWPLAALAHQPRIVETEKINITKPEVSKAYYGKLSEKPHTYTISTSSAIDLYVNVLVPFIEGPRKNVVVKIFKDGQPLESLNPGENDWKKFFEPFGQSMYWQGPEFKIRAEAGKYKIIVQSREKRIRYVLATGEIEAFDGTESLNAILLIPKLKKNFFEEPPISFIFSPLGWGYILLLQILAILVGWIISKVLKISGIKVQKEYFQKFSRSIMVWGLVFWIGLLVWAVRTSWHPVLILISGLALFLAIISWRERKT